MGLKPDIRLVIASLAGGGAERVCLLLANSWAAQGRRVELLIVRGRGEYLPMLDARVVVESANATRTLSSLLWIREKLNRWRDVPALVFGVDLAAGLGVFKHTGLLSAPLIYREGSLAHENVSLKSRWIYPICVRKVDALIAQTEESLRSLRRLGLSRVPATVIWNPVRRPVKTRNQCAESFVTGPRFLSVGRLSAEKGFLRLLNAFVKVRRQWPGSTLDVVGQGGLKPALQSTIAELGLAPEVRLHGFVGDLQEFYNQADLFILPSFYEGQSNALIEALLHGCRVVADGGATTRELLDHLGLSDCVIRDGSFEDELVAAIHRANALSAGVWSTGRRRLRERTDLMDVGEKYYGFCQQIAASASFQ